MRVFGILFGKELRAYFQSFVAYVVLAAVALLHGLIFTYSVSLLRFNPPMSLLQTVLSGSIGFWLVFILVVPLITMRLFAEEQKMGTLEPLLTAPVSTWQVILAKYFAALCFYLILFLPLMGQVLFFEKVSGASAVGGALGSTALGSSSFHGGLVMIFLLGAMFIAVGCLASALTANQIIAAVICFTVLLVYFLLGYVRMVAKNLPRITVEFLEYVSPIEHMRDFAGGLFDTRPIVYYLSFAALCLVLTAQVLDYRKWKV